MPGLEVFYKDKESGIKAQAVRHNYERETNMKGKQECYNLLTVATNLTSLLFLTSGHEDKRE